MALVWGLRSKEVIPWLGKLEKAWNFEVGSPRWGVEWERLTFLETPWCFFEHVFLAVELKGWWKVWRFLAVFGSWLGFEIFWGCFGTSGGETFQDVYRFLASLVLPKEPNKCFGILWG